jgi:hypothetical protein
VNGQQDRKIWLVAGVAATLVLVGAAWLLVIAPQRSAVATLRSDTEAVELSNATLAAKTAKLRQEAEGRAELTASLSQALAALPADDDLPEFSRQLSRQAQDRDVTLTGIVVGSATTPGTATDPAAAPGEGTTVVAPTVRAIPVTLTSTGSALQQLYFLRDIQEIGPRRALVTSTAIVPLGEGAIDTASTLTVQLTVFSAPLSEATLAQLADVLADDSD